MPLGYDRDGNPAIKVRGVFARSENWGFENGELTNLVRDTECYVSKGQWSNQPINIIADTWLENVTIARYDGEKVIGGYWPHREDFRPSFQWRPCKESLSGCLEMQKVFRDREAAQ